MKVLGIGKGFAFELMPTHHRDSEDEHEGEGSESDDDDGDAPVRQSGVVLLLRPGLRLLILQH